MSLTRISVRPLFVNHALVPALLVGLAAPFAFAAIAVDHHIPLTSENSIIGHYSASKKPVVTIKSGATVSIDGGGGMRWDYDEGNAWLRENNIPVTMESCPALAETEKAYKETLRAEGIPGGHLIVGPIYVEDAEPGDSLEVRILSVVPRIPYGAVSGGPGRGGLPDLTPVPFSFVVRLDLSRNAGVFTDGVEVPLAPFMGVMATCPPDAEGPTRKSGPPGAFGGNLDCKELKAGSTLYLPIFQKGALFYTGDSHAAQGDGEVSSTAIETANTATFQFILHKNRTLKGPRAETATHHITFGLDRDLDTAMRNATIETVEFLKEKQGYDFLRAYALTSIGVDFRVTQVVDGTVGVHGMIPKKLFFKEPNTYWYRAN